jgi:hypothetical protein
MVRTQIQLTEEQATELKRLAHASGQSMAQVIRCAVDQYLAPGRRNSPADRKRRALEAVGSLRSETGDLSENHGAYLGAAYLA